MLNEKYKIVSWEEINYEGGEAKVGVGSAYRSGIEKGGLKIRFKDSEGNSVAYIWMRGSGTEPVFRVLADVKGSVPEAEKFFLDWHVAMLEEADSL